MQVELWILAAIVVIGYIFARTLDKRLIEMRNIRFALERISEDDRLHKQVSEISERLSRL